MAEPTDPRVQEMVREAAGLMGKLFINRRDRKASYRQDFRGNWHWTALNTPFKMGDFVTHLTRMGCLGAYLLNTDNTVKFMAFDIDAKKTSKYWLCYDIDQINALEERGYGFDLDLQFGLFEAALHDPSLDAHRWVRIILLEAIRHICKAVRELDLTPLTVITGGGAHVLVPFPEPVAAADARLVGNHLVSELPTVCRLDKMFWNYGPLGELTIEVFPKQDTLVGKDYGNLIRLPYGWHHEASIRTYSIDPDALTCPLWEWNKISSLTALRGLAAAGADAEGTE